MGLKQKQSEAEVRIFSWKIQVFKKLFL